MKKKITSSARFLLGLFIFISFTVTACNNYGKKINYDKNELYYKGDATESEAKKLGDYLREGGKYFDQNTNFAVQLEKKEGNYTVRFVVDEKKLKSSAGLEESYNAIREELSNHIFNNQAITVEITDGNFKTIKTYNSRK